tara:strand:- start:291 stop:995 length:705 start_codon:yes stop_codon:yes gene_type:complete
MRNLVKAIKNLFLEAVLNFLQSQKLLQSGAQFKKLSSVELDGEILVGRHVKIGREVSFKGKVELSDGVTISDNCKLKDCFIGPNTDVRTNSLIEDSEISSDSFVGPFARIRSNTKIGKQAQIGNFVEIKSSSIGKNCRINHMAFIGDASIGDNVTIGAGTITCNHDGIGINTTIIEDGAYVGSNVNLVAPLIVGSNSTIGSGSTITKDVPKSKLTLARSRQETINNWRGPKLRR